MAGGLWTSRRQVSAGFPDKKHPASVVARTTQKGPSPGIPGSRDNPSQCRRLPNKRRFLGGSLNKRPRRPQLPGPAVRFPNQASLRDFQPRCADFRSYPGWKPGSQAAETASGTHNRRDQQLATPQPLSCRRPLTPASLDSGFSGGIPGGNDMKARIF